MVVDVASLLLQVELDPVVESNEFIPSAFSHKDVFKTARVVTSEKKKKKKKKYLHYP